MPIFSIRSSEDISANQVIKILYIKLEYDFWIFLIEDFALFYQFSRFKSKAELVEQIKKLEQEL